MRSNVMVVDTERFKVYAEADREKGIKEVQVCVIENGVMNSVYFTAKQFNSILRELNCREYAVSEPEVN